MSVWSFNHELAQSNLKSQSRWFLGLANNAHYFEQIFLQFKRYWKIKKVNFLQEVKVESVSVSKSISPKSNTSISHL